MLDIGLAAKKTMALHAPIKLLLKSPLLPRFHSVSFRLVSGQDLQVSGCDIRDSMLSTPNRLHKDARQKNSNAARAFIYVRGKREGSRQGSRRGRVKKEKKERNSYLWIWIFMDSKEKKIPKEKGGKEGRKRGKHFFLLSLGYRWSRPASLFYQEKMLIINLRLHATSLFNS